MFLIPGLELVLLIALIAANPLRFAGQTRWSRWVSLLLTALIVETNLFALGMLVNDLVVGIPLAPRCWWRPCRCRRQTHRIRVALLGVRSWRPGVPHPNPPPGDCRSSISVHAG